MIPEAQEQAGAEGRRSDPPGNGDAAIPPAGTVRPRRRRSRASSRALAMLSLLPVHALPVPKVHVEPRRPDGTIAVFDRPSGAQLIVHTPRFDRQFHAGHRSGFWYVRTLMELGSEPCSLAFPTAKAAIDAVAEGRWRKGAGQVRQVREVIRVIWPARACRGNPAADSLAPHSQGSQQAECDSN